MCIMDSFQSIYATVTPIIEEIGKRTNPELADNQSTDNELSTFLLDFYFSRVIEAIKLKHIWTTETQDEGPNSDRIVLIGLRTYLLDRSRQLAQSVYQTLQSTRIADAEVDEHLRGMNLLFSSIPMNSDFTRIEKNYQSSRAYVKHLLIRARGMQEYLLANSIVIDKEKLLNLFQYQQIFIDREGFLSEQMFTLIDQLLHVKIELNSLNKSLEFRMAHSNECSYKDEPFQMKENSSQHSVTIFGCGEQKEVPGINESYEIRRTHNTESIGLITQDELSESAQRIGRINISQFVRPRNIDPNDWNNRLESTHLIMNKGCKVETRKDQRRAKVMEVDLMDHKDDPVLIWRGVQKTLTKIATSLKFTLTEDDVLDLETFQLLLESYIRAYDQGFSQRAKVETPHQECEIKQTEKPFYHVSHFK